MSSTSVPTWPKPWTCGETRWAWNSIFSFDTEDDLLAKPKNPAPGPRGGGQPQTGALYTLSDPRDGTVRYVGQTTNHLQLRLSQHINNPTNPGMRMWINGLTADAQVPRIDLLREVPAADLDEAEHAEILAHLGAGHPLLNHPYYLAHSAVDQAPGQPSHRATVGSSRVGSGAASDSWRRRLKRRLKELKHRETQALHRWILAEEQRRLAEDVQRSEVKAGHFDAYTLTATIKRLVVDSEEARRRYLAVRKTRKRTARLRRPGWVRRRRKKVPSRLGLGLRRLKLILRRKTLPVAPYVPTLLRDRQPFQHPAKYEGGHLITSWGGGIFRWSVGHSTRPPVHHLPVSVAWRADRLHRQHRQGSCRHT
ncbi:hypothetical protein SAMN05446589_7366 [Streptomyces sp. OV198]|nr:hypothetical protein SAMN05446589_7366 [Streptomyces sp. OV198]